MLRVRYGTDHDYDRIMEIYRYAQDYMIQSGNPNQWGHIYAEPDLIKSDIQNGLCRVIFDEDGIHGVFALLEGTESTYQHIEDGEWLNDKPYKEATVVKEMEALAKQFSAIPIHVSHIGLFAGGKVLYAAPDMNPADLLNLRKEIKTETQETFPWTPHVTILMDEKETIQKALPILLDCFHPFMGRITKLHLCAFWPTREIATVYLEK